MDVLTDIEQKLFQIDTQIKTGNVGLQDFSELLPASVMVHRLEASIPQEISYMNSWGCENLGVELEELNSMKQHYYQKFFVEEDVAKVMPSIAKYCASGEDRLQYSFYQRVLLYGNEKHQWFYTVCKKLALENKHYLLMLSSPLSGADRVTRKITRVLEDDRFIAANYRRFAVLTPREKEIISWVAAGKTSADIAEILFISPQTVITHRKNINRKLEVENFSQLLKFALAFELVSE